MKPKNWRTYYWYRRNWFVAEQNCATRDDLKRQADEYLEWLAERRGVSRSDAKKIVGETRFRDDIISEDHAPEKTTAREETWIGDGVTVRTLRCFSTGKKMIYGWRKVSWSTSENLCWHPLPVESDAPTTYVVVERGRVVARYLKKSLAIAHAMQLANRRIAA